MRFSVTRIATGPQIHYVEVGDTGGVPIIFLHGWPDSLFSFSRVLPRLPKRYRSVVPDQRGFGDSERPAHGYGIPDMAADAVAFMDALSIRQATLIGHSFGSFVARCVALTAPERVDRLVLIGSGWSAANPVITEVQASLQDLADPVPAEFAREFQAGTVHKPVPASFFDGLVAESLKLPARLWREVLDGLVEYDDRQDLPRISSPTLLLWGEKDALFPRADQDRLQATIPGATLKIYPDTGHCPNWECPGEIATDLDGFLSGRPLP